MDVGRRALCVVVRLHGYAFRPTHNALPIEFSSNISRGILLRPWLSRTNEMGE